MPEGPVVGREWVLATGNAGKLREFNHRFSAVGIAFRPQSDFQLTGVDETGTTFVENAILKARAAAAASGLPALADDSGLCVDALAGAPGVYSARYAGPDASDEDNNRQLLAALAGNPNRAAQFCCALVLMTHADDPLPLIVQTTWSGRIVDEPKGRGGFGYDPLFQVDGLSVTSAELSADDKNRLSHRGQAITRLLEKLK
ncbi:MAG: RdgB/HAM1 family non-canonical purine NTP pyrophosphatase [Pseudomonadota bacterium]